MEIEKIINSAKKIKTQYNSDAFFPFNNNISFIEIKTPSVELSVQINRNTHHLRRKNE